VNRQIKEEAENLKYDIARLKNCIDVIDQENERLKQEHALELMQATQTIKHY